MELRDIEYFAAVAKHGNVTRASESLGLSPPALSKSLRRLEKAMHAKLVERSPKGVELTAVGSALLAQVRRIRLTLEDVAREAADLSEGRAGHLRIGASAARAEELSSAFARLLREAPSASLSVTVSDNDVLVPALRNGELDLIFNYLTESPHEGCVKELLYGDEQVVYASVNHPLAKQKVVTIADLARERWALSPVNALPWHWLYRAFQDRGFSPPRVALETRSIRLRLQAVASTNLVGFISIRIIQQAAPRFGLKALPVKEMRWRRQVGVIYREGGYLSPAARRFVEILRTTAGEITKQE